MAVAMLVTSAGLMFARVQRPAERPPMVMMIREGWHYVLRHPIIGPSMWDVTVTNFVCGAMLALFPYYLVRELHASPLMVGVLLAADGLGTLIGAALTTRLTDRVGTARGLIVA